MAIAVINPSSNPASALVASSRPPIPLAPRLTTASTSQQNYSPVSLPGSSSQSTAMSTRETSSSAHPRHRQLLHRTSQPVATQALNVDTSPPAARFSAYVPRPSRSRWQGEYGRVRGAGTATNTRHSSHMSTDEFDLTTRAKKRNGLQTLDDDFQVLSQFRLDADFAGDVLVRCSGSDFYVHRA